MNLPRILVIDDQFGRSIKARRNLCLNFALKDLTGDDKSPESIKGALAEAVFYSAQREKNGSIINNIQGTLSAVKQGWPHADGWSWSMILLDIRFVSGKIGINKEPEGQSGDDDFGMRIVEEIYKNYPDIPVVMLSSRERRDVLEECLRKGAKDFIQRVADSAATTSLKEILRQKLFEHALLPDTREPGNGFKIVGNSLSILKTLRLARKYATGTGNILILGETGTGKELFARYIHDISPKSSGPYEVFHPHGRPETLQEDELFGHVKGAFAGATSNRAGLFEMADKGTFFIDEIGDIPESLQNNLLRPLESRSVKRLGGTTETHFDSQIILATNKNLDEYTRTEKFKFDLLNRIKGSVITLPPLRERKDDIPLIAEKLLEDLCRENDARWPREILPDAMEMLKGHDWPDNVRGLKNVLEHVVKTNRDLELVVPSHIVLEVDSKPVKAQVAERTARVRAGVPAPETPAGDIDALIDSISIFEFPEDYSKLQGKLPELQKAVARMFAKYLASSIEVTRKMKPNGPVNGEVNLTGAASCIMGEQLKTPKAADLIKRLLQQDKAALEEIVKEYPVLNMAYNEVLRLRPKKTNKIKSSKRR